MEMLSQNRDAMTGLWNRTTGLAALEEAVQQGRSTALIFCDVDNIYFFNDQFGHDKGDQKLVEIARSIELWSGENAFVFRFGGDEFCVVLTDCSLEKARQIAETIRANQQSVRVEDRHGNKMALTLSLGLAHFPTHVESAQALIEAADLALLKAKRGGRLADTTPYAGKNRVMAIGDFLR